MADAPGDVVALVLAGGASRRMGRDKALLELGGRPLVAHVVERLRTVVPDVRLVARSAEQFQELGVLVVLDLAGMSDPLGAIISGLRAVSASHAFVCAVDMPGLHPPLVRTLLERALEGGHELVAPAGPRGIEPLHAVYARAALPALERQHAEGRLRLQELPQVLRSLVLSAEELSPYLTPWALRSVNTPEALERFLAGG